MLKEDRWINLRRSNARERHLNHINNSVNRIIKDIITENLYIKSRKGNLYSIVKIIPINEHLFADDYIYQVNINFIDKLEKIHTIVYEFASQKRIRNKFFEFLTNKIKTSSEISEKELEEYYNSILTFNNNDKCLYRMVKEVKGVPRIYNEENFY